MHKNNKLVVDYLLECGAKPSLACRDGTTPLHFVAMQGVDYLDVAEFLCRSPAISLNHSNAHGMLLAKLDTAVTVLFVSFVSICPF